MRIVKLKADDVAAAVMLALWHFAPGLLQQNIVAAVTQQQCCPACQELTLRLDTPGSGMPGLIAAPSSRLLGVQALLPS
jgi:hypothetical protein